MNNFDSLINKAKVHVLSNQANINQSSEQEPINQLIKQNYHQSTNHKLSECKDSDTKIGDAISWKNWRKKIWVKKYKKDLVEKFTRNIFNKIDTKVFRQFFLNFSIQTIFLHFFATHLFFNVSVAVLQ